jgi:hypothetical protein
METMRKLSDPARPSKVHIIVAKVCRLIAMDGVVLATANGALCGRSVKDSLDSHSQWRQVGIGGLPGLVRRGCRRLEDTDTALGLNDC